MALRALLILTAVYVSCRADDSRGIEGIARHVAELGHDDFRTRETAQKRILELCRSNPVLLAALPLDARDPEARSRVAEVWDTLSREFLSRGLSWEIILSKVDRQHLLRLLDHPSSDVVSAARFNLALIDPGSLAGFSEAFREKASLRLALIRIVRDRRDTGYLRTLAELALDPVPAVRAAATEALCALDPARAEDLVADAAARLLQDPSLVVRRGVIQCVASRRLGKARDSILPLLNDPYPSIRCATIEAIAALNGSEAGVSILPMLEDEDPMVRQTAAATMAKLKPGHPE